MAAGKLAIKAVIAADDQFTSTMQKIAGRVKPIGKKLTKDLSQPLADVGIAAVKASVAFNASMANVATLIPGSIGRVEELKESVQDLSIETGKSTEDLAGGLYGVIRAFGDSADTPTILAINAKTAAAGLATTTDAINLTSAVTKGYGDTSAAAIQKAADLAFMTNKLGQTTFPELAGSLRRVIPLAVELNVSQEDLFGVMATATGVTGNAAEVSTQFRGVLQSLLSPTKDMSTLIQQSGFESGKALLQQKGLQGTLELITQASREAGIGLQKFIGSIEGQTLALALTGVQAENLTKKTAAMKEVTGATDEAFAAQTQGIGEAGFMMTQVTQKLAVASQQLGDEVVGTALSIIKNWDVLDPYFTKMWAKVRAVFEEFNTFVLDVFDVDLKKLSTPEMAKSLSGAGAMSAAMASAWQRSANEASVANSVSPSALPQAGEHRLIGQIRVSFENVPPGTRVREARVDPPGIEVQTDVGLSFAHQLGAP